jgi:tetratricopeptide (TPR) repeat protein
MRGSTHMGGCTLIRRAGGRALLAALFLSGVPHTAARAQAPWYVSYEDALTALGTKEWSRSIALLQDALKEKPHERLKAKTYGLRFVNYLPYYSLGTAYYHLRDRRQALACFDSSLNQKAILDAPAELSQLQRMRTDLLDPAAIHPPPVAARSANEGAGAEAPHPAPAAETAPVGGADEAGSGESGSGQLWYVHYEAGLAYIESGDWLKAAENLKLALAANALPHRYARTYGMWFVRYMPYYYLGVAYFNQGLWHLSVNYFDVSRRFEETKDLESESATLADLLARARSLSGSARARRMPAELGELVSGELSEAIRLYNRQEYEAAATHFRAVETLDPYNSVAKSYLGRLAARADRPEPARPGTREDFSDGILRLLRGKPDEALDAFARAESLLGSDPAYHGYMGVAYALKHRAGGKKETAFLRKAESEFRRALVLDPAFHLDEQVFSRDVISLFAKVKRERTR